MKNSEDILTSNLLQLLKDLMKYWYLLVISLVIFISFSLFYLKYASKTYKVNSSVLLMLEGGNNLGRGPNDILRAFDIVAQDKKLQNEVYFMQSLPLIREVVGDMDLRTFYYMQDELIPKRFTFSYTNIYNSSPFMVIPTDNHPQPAEIYIHVKILDEEKFQISASSDETVIMSFSNERVLSNSANFNLNGIYNFGSLIENEMASFTILLNSNFDPERYIGKDMFFKFNNLNWLAGSFKGALSINSQNIESSLAELSFKSPNSRLGLEFLDALINKYINTNLDEANFLANKTIEHIDRQLVDVSDELTRSEQQLQTLRSDNSVMNIEEKAQNVYVQLENARVMREETQRRLGHLNQLNDYFTEFKDSSMIMAPSAFNLTDPLLNTLIQNLMDLNTDKQRIISQDQLRNPRLQTIDISINNLKNQITENINFSINSARRELNDLNSKISTLDRQFAELPGTQRQLLGIERRFNLNDAIYTSLLERRIQAQIVKASKLPDARIIEPPKHMGVASPNRIIVLFFSVFIGLLLPSLFVISVKLIANSVASKDDIKAITALPIIGSIPTNDNPQQNVVREHPRSPIAEAFHILRTNLVYYLRGDTHKTILVTSSLPGEGKSFSSINLATSFALANSKTVLVEFDLRNPNKFINEVFNAKELVGISSYLIKKATLEEIIVPTEVPNLDIIQAGQIPPNPIELISSTRTHDLFNELRKIYDFIIIDTPPYGLVTDAFYLMNIADIKLYVTRLGYTKKKALAANIEDIEGKNIKDVYLLANDNNEDKLRYGKYAYTDKTKKGKKPLISRMEHSRKKIAVL
jgi:tyrosine-protein kinase Etk/Wzc